MKRVRAFSQLGFLFIHSLWTWVLVLGYAGWSSAGTITVDLSLDQGMITHRANGYLVSLESAQPSLDDIRPLRPTSFRGSSRHVLQNYERLQDVGVKEFQLTLGYVFQDLSKDIFDINRIGLDGDYTPWIRHIDHVIDQVLERRLSVLWDIYNEPDLAMPPMAQNGRLQEGWKMAYQRIKERIPEALVVGPSVSRYRFLKPLLEWSQAHQVLPDIVAYHEYGDPSEAGTYVEDLRDYLGARRLSRPISVNEILGQESWTIAGYTVGVLAAYERADILSAMRACWPDPQDMSRENVENTCDNPTLGGLLYVDRQMKRPGWHIYKAYAEMQGIKVAAITDSPSLHALATLDNTSGTLRLLLGKYGDYSGGETRVTLKHADLLIASQIKKTLHVCAYQIPDVGSGPLESPVLALDQTLSFEEAVVSFTLQQFYHSDAYEVVISPFHQCPR